MPAISFARLDAETKKKGNFLRQNETMKGTSKMSTYLHTYTKGSVISRDGTTIGYRQMGSGPGLLLLHGGINASQHLMKLGTALADTFTVYIPDRRGRGMSGPLGNNYSITKEDEDLDALLQHTGARFVFGTADGAFFALHAAISLPAISKVVAYEPVLLFGQPGEQAFEATIDQYNQNIASGNLARTMVGLTKAAHADTGKVKAIPDFLLEPLFHLVLASDARKAKGDNLSYRELLPTLGAELQLVRATKGTLEDYTSISAEVLFLVGSKSNDFLKSTSIALSTMLPHARLVELQDLAHGSAQDYGKPDALAREIRRFLQANISEKRR